MVVLGVLLLVPFLIVIMRLIAAFIIDAWNDRLDDFYGLFVFGGIALAVLTNFGADGAMAQIAIVAGLLAIPALVAAGLLRWKGQKRRFPIC